LTIARARLITVTNINYEKARNRPNLQVCPNCKKGFKVGLVIVTKKSTKTRWYHKKCAERLNIWSDEQ
jgi:hypothetical protein